MVSGFWNRFENTRELTQKPEDPRLDLAKKLIAEGFSSPFEIANILSQIKAETGSFNPVEENLNYSPERLMEVFPQKFQNLAHATQVVKAGPEAIGNVIYGGRMGNKEDEGYKYRGRGFIQLTGRDNYERLGKLIGEDLVNNPDLANDPEVALKIAAAYLKESGADLKDVASTTKAIGPAQTQQQIAKRLEGQKEMLAFLEEQKPEGMSMEEFIAL